jgi:hypothetical protein
VIKREIYKRIEEFSIIGGFLEGVRKRNILRKPVRRAERTRYASVYVSMVRSFLEYILHISHLAAAQVSRVMITAGSFKWVIYNT